MARLYIVRHATAQSAGECGDFARQLTPRGQLQARLSGKALQAGGRPPEVVFTSPAHRALETAETLAAEIVPPPRMEIVDILYPGGPWEALLEAMPDLRTAGAVALVSHLPFVEHLTQSLLAETATLRFLPSALYCLDFDGPPGPGSGRLAWSHAPADS